ncbi:tetraacyldisaccharide 4'-kinase [Tepidimonas taiwanensis]|uniref:Tetraacyldisaccharide 4'-kinase n=1 Tax=Tepidimonas taiwanensis TaxID=307486 RepID=A0A554XBC4_9BURK|nr:tetraacyldisaccharide 4'-kinase [Tepidimonas taiwanensis]TSE33143.1 Tetraacyldisaccharide 4'-kinase [Tepidimonas taiwanensis]UBQ05952.1 tetraacyldisaccharide 4'-kinase [Tepidimonas taiwanensis]
MSAPDPGRLWLARGPLAWALRPLACLYGAALAARGWWWRHRRHSAQRLPVPVVVVGNVVAGGAGKTPTVIALLHHLRTRGWMPGVVSRGYGRTGGGRGEPLVLDPGALADPERCGDEPALIARETGVPIAVGADRPAAARALLRRHPAIDIVVSDDGMQHWALARDLTIVVFDERDVGNGRLLPAGPLRQPWPAPIWGGGPALVLRTAPPREGPRPHPYPEFRSERALADQAFDPAGHARPLADWARDGTPLGAIAGIARPAAFFGMLRARGLNLTRTLARPDHASAADLLAALRSAAALPDAPRVWLCTDKDAVKLQRAPLPDRVTVWRVPLRLVIEPAWYAAVDRVLAPLRPRPGAL